MGGSSEERHVFDWKTFFSKSYDCRVDPAFGFSRLHVRLEVPVFPPIARNAGFAHHGLLLPGRSPGNTVVSTQKGGAAVSHDLGKTWTYRSICATKRDSRHLPLYVGNAFVTAEDTILLQVKAPPRSAGFDDEFAGSIVRLNRNLEVEDIVPAGTSHWHGSCSIGQSGGTIMFAEYPSNRDKYRILADGGADDVSQADLRDPAVYRSRDDGRSWQKVFCCSWQEIRHFHTLAADPFAERTWWLSSGDTPGECKIWKSCDDGDSWLEVSKEHPKLETHPSIANRTRSAYRFTDLWMDEERIVWGIDDWLGGASRVNDDCILPGQRAGSRIYVARKDTVAHPLAHHLVGNPIRTVTEVGDCLLFTTEAKREIMRDPQVFLMSQKNPELCQPLFCIENLGAEGTGFTFSRASRKAKDGCVFTHRCRYDVCDAPTRMLRWRFEAS